MLVHSRMQFVSDKWYELKENSCKLIYQEAKERFEEFASESESITNKSIKIFSAVISIAAFFIGYALSHTTNCFAFILLGVMIILFIWELVILFILIAPKKVRFRGVDAETSFKKDIVDPENKDCQIQATYFTVVSALKENADVMFTKNQTRSAKYQTALFLLYGIILSVGAYVGFTLSHF